MSTGSHYPIWLDTYFMDMAWLCIPQNTSFVYNVENYLFYILKYVLSSSRPNYFVQEWASCLITETD